MTTLIIKRKFTTAIDNPEQLASVVDQAMQNVQDTISNTTMVVQRMEFTKRLKIPCGTDMYD